MSRWEVGTRSPREWLPFLARVLGVPREMLETAKTVQLPDSAPRVLTVADFLPEGDPLSALTARTGRRIGAGQVADLVHRVHGLRLADDVVYGKDLIGPALRELRTAAKLYREGSHTEEVGRELLRTIGELAQIAGWVASDAGERAEAERIYRLGMSAAREAGTGCVRERGGLTGLPVEQHRTPDGRGAPGRAALRTPVRTPRPKLARSIWTALPGRTPAPARTASDDRARGGGRHPGRGLAGTESPSYLYWMDAGELRVMEARVYTELRRPLRAVPLLTDVLGRYERQSRTRVGAVPVVAGRGLRRRQQARGRSRDSQPHARTRTERQRAHSRAHPDRPGPAAGVPRRARGRRTAGGLTVLNESRTAHPNRGRCLRQPGPNGAGPSSVGQLRRTRVLRGPPRLTG